KKDEKNLKTLNLLNKFYSENKNDIEVVIYLSKILQPFPIESLPSFQNISITRNLSLETTIPKNKSFGNNILSIKSGGYILNPGNDLPNTENRFRTFFDQLDFWKGLIGKGAKSDFEEILSVL
ncbi:separin protein, variant 2, partial [Bonamia ostreae]